jgi:phosphate uptake regulator
VPDLEQRKIQKVGRSTLSVSLPKAWVNLVGLKPGDTVHIDQGKDESLRIFSEKNLGEASKPNEYFINCDQIKEPNLLERLIVGGYMTGVDVIKIYASNRIKGKQVEEVRNIVQRLVGASIMEASRNEIILQCFINASKLNIYSLLQRLSVITSTMLNEAMEALLTQDPELANDVIKREDEANNIYWLIARLLLSAQKSPTLAENIGLDEAFSPLSVRLVSKNLERIADCSKGLAKIALDLHTMKAGIDLRELKKLSSIDQLTKELFKKAVESLFSRDVITANEALNLRVKLDTEVEGQMRKAIIPYYRAISIMLAMIAENSGTMASVAINIEISKSNSFPSQVS